MRRLVTVVMLLAAAMCLSSCSNQKQEPIKVGALFAVTGPAFFLGEPEKNTAKMMVDDINAKGGLNGRKLELIVYDTAGDTTKAVQLATKLIKNDKVVAIIGPSTTGESMAVIPVVEKENIPLISCAAGIKITEPAKKWVFKTPANDYLAAEKIINHLNSHNRKKVAILTVTDSYGSSGREQLKELAARKGIEVVADEVYGPKDTDMTSQLTKIRGINPDAVICWGTNPGPAVVTRNVRQLGLKMPLYMSHGVASKKYIELAGADTAEGVMLPAGKLAVYAVLPQSDPQARILKEYDTAYKKAFGNEASTFGGYAYDAILLLTNAIKNGASTPAQIRDGIEQAKDVISVSGRFNMSPKDHNGLDISAFEMVRISNGGWQLIK